MRTIKLVVVISITLDRPDAILSFDRDIARIKTIIKKTYNFRIKSGICKRSIDNN
jgi:hypothetical protein